MSGLEFHDRLSSCITNQQIKSKDNVDINSDSAIIITFPKQSAPNFNLETLFVNHNFATIDVRLINN